VEELKSGQGREREGRAHSIERVRSSERGVDMRGCSHFEGGEGGKGGPPGHDSNLTGNRLVRTLYRGRAMPGETRETKRNLAKRINEGKEETMGGTTP
jgi:hypothetical protein